VAGCPYGCSLKVATHVEGRGRPSQGCLPGPRAFLRHASVLIPAPVPKEAEVAIRPGSTPEGGSGNQESPTDVAENPQKPKEALAFASAGVEGHTDAESTA